MQKSICKIKDCRNFGKYCRIPGHAPDVEAPKVSLSKKVIPKGESNSEKTKLKQRTAFFDMMASRRPKNCQESGKPLAGSMVINPRSIVAHILPKRDADKGGVPSMQYDPRNILFLDQDVHADMDRKGSAFVKQMKSLPLMKKRVEEMWGEIPEEERRNVPEYLRPE